MTSTEPDENRAMDTEPRQKTS